MLLVGRFQLPALMGLLCLAACSTLAAAEFEVVILKDGQRITGEVVSDKPNALYVDLGYDILRIPRDQVLRRAKIDEAVAGAKTSARGTELDSSGFFTAGVLKPMDAFRDPQPKGCDVVEHLSAERCNSIFDAGRNFGEDLAGDEPVALETAKRLGQGFLADAFDVLDDARETHGAPVVNDHAHGPERPFVGDASDHLTRE